MCHCKSQAQAEDLQKRLVERLKEVGLELNTSKTKIVYCKDDDRRGEYPNISFDFLGYTFRPRRSKNRWGKHFINFTPAISKKASKAIRQAPGNGIGTCVVTRNWRIYLGCLIQQSGDGSTTMVNTISRHYIPHYVV